MILRSSIIKASTYAIHWAHAAANLCQPFKYPHQPTDNYDEKVDDERYPNEILSSSSSDEYERQSENEYDDNFENEL